MMQAGAQRARSRIMANPHGPGLKRTSTGEFLLPDPPNFDELRQIALLAEAALLSFTATPAALAPYGQATLRWQVRMPTTVIPEVHVELHLYDGLDDRVVDPAGARVVAPYG